MCEYCKQKWWVDPNNFTATHPNFCLKCGTPLTPPVPLSLEQLRDIDGDPVWICDIECQERSCWRLCYWDIGKYLVMVAVSQTGYLLDEYGETWVAYTRKPAEE